MSVIWINIRSITYIILKDKDRINMIEIVWILWRIVVATISSIGINHDDVLQKARGLLILCFAANNNNNSTKQKKKKRLRDWQETRSAGWITFLRITCAIVVNTGIIPLLMYTVTKVAYCCWTLRKVFHMYANMNSCIATGGRSKRISIMLKKLRQVFKSKWLKYGMNSVLLLYQRMYI